VEGSAGTVANCTVQRSKRRMLVHLLNFNATRVATVRDTSVRVLLPNGEKAAKATLRVPGVEEETELAVQTDAGSALINLPELQYYALITVQW